jgi:hypothetical protein
LSNAKTETSRVRDDIPMRRLVVSMQNKERIHHQMLCLPTALGEMFNKTDGLSWKELDPVMHILRVTDPELHDDYRSARVIKDTGVRHLKTPEAAGTPVTADSSS